MSGEQDIQKMGGLWGKIPVTARTFFVASLAIAGIPPLAGFFSKDEILGSAFARHPALWVVGLITAGMTAFYMFRLVFLTFFGYSRADDHAQKHIHESPPTMTIPLMVLAVLSVVGGWIGWPAALGGTNHFEKFLEPVVSSAGATASAKAVAESSTTEYFLMLASIAIAVAGIWLAYHRTKRFAPGKMKGFYRLLFHKYYVDELYDALFVNRTKDLGTLLGQLDAKVIDGVGVDGTGWLARFGSTLSMWWDKWIIDGLLNFGAKFTQLLSFPIRFLQTGTFSTYALLILVGLAILLAYYQQHLHVVLRGAR
jgi:NADH-quinone oxidoreductase subunit L